MEIQSFTERMQTGRDLAAGKRYKGISTGKAAAGHIRKASDVRPPDDWHELIELQMAFVLAECVNDLNYSDGCFEGCSDIPF